jgi:electron transfer flavoprotein beta subunit
MGNKNTPPIGRNQRVKILVCVKQVPDLEARPELDAEKGWVKKTPPPRYRMNNFDEYALEEALRLRESSEGTTVDALSLGPARVCEVLKKAIAMGCDQAIHIDLPREGFLPAQTTAQLIARFAATGGYDLILTGAMAEDDMQGVVGPMIAEILGVCCAVSVLKTDPDASQKTLRVTCELEGCRRGEILLAMPAVITIQSGANKPRYPSVGNVLRSRSQEVRKVPAGPFSEVFVKCGQTVSLPKKSEKTEFLEGSLDEKAEKLLAILAQKSFLR